MFYLLFVIIQLAIAAVVLYLAAIVAVFVLTGAALTGAVTSLTQFVTVSVGSYYRGDTPLDTLQIEPPPRSDTESEPAYRSYWFGPVARELAILLQEAGAAEQVRLRAWIQWIREDAWERSDSPYWKVPVFLPCLAAGVGLVAGAVLGAVFLGCVTVVFAVLLIASVGLTFIIASVARVLELGALWVRGITLECPNCHERVTRPIYRCSNKSCGAAHRSLVPGSLGVLARVCRCGTSLPTLLFRKKNLDAQCQHCEFMLPKKGFSAPTLHIPVAGGPQVGKSVFMFAAVKRLYDEAGGDESPDDFWADARFAKEFAAAYDGIKNPDQMRKTTETRPRAYNIYLGRPRSRRLVYLYDTAGEIYDDSGALARAGFYTFTKGIVICIDPFSLAGLRRRVERSTLDRVRSLPSDPKATIERLTENLRETMKVNGSKRLGIKAAVVLTKADALGQALVKHPYATLGADGAADRRTRDQAVRTWVAETGVRSDIVSSIEQNFDSSSFFVVSHADALPRGRAASRSVNDDPARPIQWLLDGGSTR